MSGDDDDLRRAYRAAAQRIQPTIHQPPVREIMFRARGTSGTRRDMSTSKPAPLVAILALGATPLVVLGVVLIGPAGAGIMPGGSSLPTSPGVAPSAESPEVPPANVLAVTATTPAPKPTVGSAVVPLTEVTVYFADSRLVSTDGCRRLTAATRLVPADDQVGGALTALLAGPRADERAVGLVSQFFTATDPVPLFTVTADSQTTSAVVDVTDLATLDGTAVDCRLDEIDGSLSKTVSQFDTWTVTLSVSGSPDVAGQYLAEDPTKPAPPAGEPAPDSIVDPSADASADPSADPNVDTSADSSADASHPSF